MKEMQEEAVRLKKTIVLDPKMNEKNIEKYLLGLIQDIFPLREYWEWFALDLVQPKNQPPGTPPAGKWKNCHYELWYAIVDHLNPPLNKR